MLGAPIHLAFVLFLALVTLTFPASATAQTTSVEAELRVPQAETHVIGDPISVIWKFTNRSSDPLAFMWDGCCRLNGRLDVRRQGVEVEAVPASQALAHMFAKAEQLQPGQTREYETRLSDWAALKESGAYQLQGTYVGVRPEQRPQVPRGVSLWRDAATTPRVELSVLSVADYLAQRQERTRERGIELTLGGPAAFEPLKTALFQLRLKNHSSESQRLVWPNDFQLWIVNPSGERLAASVDALEGDYAEITLPPGGALQREVAVNADKLEGERFGTYQVFIDLAAKQDKPRVPSNPVTTIWNLDQREVAKLLETAASGHKAGLRNAPLKLLRVHLSDIRPSLESLTTEALPPETAALAGQLKLAACLKPLAPKPGKVEIPLRVEADGSMRLADTLFSSCLGSVSGGALEQVSAVLNVRRHLGWQVALALRPQDATKLGQLPPILSKISTMREELDGAPVVTIPMPGSTNAVRLTFQEEPAAGGNGIRIRKTSAEANLILETPVDVQEDKRGSDVERLERWLDSRQKGAEPVPVTADAGISFHELRSLLQPLADRGASALIRVAP